jgi:antitoxin component YwqK of YwqJK toxin-antitoxin module
MLHKACFVVAMWFIAPFVHAQYTIAPMMSLLVEEVPAAGHNDEYFAASRANNPVPLSVLSDAYKLLPVDVLQYVVRWHNEGNDRSAKMTGWYANGQQAIILNTHRSSLHGVWQTWYQNGQLRDAGTFVHNIPNGEWRSWYATGKLRSIRQYDAHKMQMVEVAVRQRNPKLAFHPISQEAIRHPEKMKSLLSPVLAIAGYGRNASTYEYPFEQCLHQGFYANYYENGTMQQSGYYKDGLKDGLWMQWHPDGTMVSSGYYQHGLLHGAKKEFNSVGNMQKMTEYKHGKKVFEKKYSR